MRAALGYDRQYTNAQMGTEMNSTEMTELPVGPWITPSVKVATGAEWLEFGCAYYWQCGSRVSDVVVIDTWDSVSEMHLCTHCHEHDVSEYGEMITTVRTRIRVKPVKEDAGFVETNEIIAGIVDADEYDAEMAIVESEDMYDGMRNRLKNKACGYRPFLKVVPDMRNNVGRRCSYTRNGENLGRVWELVTPMRDQEFVSYYLIRNTLTGEQHIVWDRLLHNLY